MVSGFNTSPLEVDKIDSGEPKPIEILLNLIAVLSFFLRIICV